MSRYVLENENVIKEYINLSLDFTLISIEVNKLVDGIKIKFILDPNDQSLLISSLQKPTLCIYNFDDEVLVRFFSHDNNSDIKYLLYRLICTLEKEIMSNWIPDLYLSFTFKPIIYPDYYYKAKEIII